MRWRTRAACPAVMARRSRSAISSSPTCARIARRCWPGSAGTRSFRSGAKTPTRLADYFVERGYRAILSCVDTEQLDGAFCGRAFDAALLADLPQRVDPCGENGEFHTCVHAGPIFSGAITLERGERVLRDGRFQYVDLTEAADLELSKRS